MIRYEKALKVLKSGGIVIYPTDTVFGIGCSIKFDDSVKRICKIKKRGEDCPLSVAFFSLKQMKEYTDIDKSQERIIKDAIKKKEPFTFIVKKNDKISNSISKGDTVGIRIPDHGIIRKLTKEFPIITTSANIHGNPAVSESKHLDPEITNAVDMVIGGKCRYGKPSKVINLISKEVIRN